MILVQSIVLAVWLALAGPLPPAPIYKIASGSVVDMHIHGKPGRIGTTYHVWISDVATSRIYTCSVPRSEYDWIRSVRDIGTACFARRGRL